MRKSFIALSLTCLLAVSPAMGRASAPNTLPPTVSRYAAPVGDSTSEYARTVQLSLPAALGGQLTMVPERMLLEPFKHPADAVVKRLLSFPGDDNAMALWSGGALQLLSGSVVELSGDVATVNLAATALVLDARSLYTVTRAIANTLTQFSDIRYVNVLVAGMQPGVDTASTFPAGSLPQTDNEDALARWENINAQAGAVDGMTRRFSSIATLYFPVAAGRGVMAEARPITIAGQTREQMAAALIQALSQGAQTLPGVPRFADLNSLMDEVPALVTLPGTGERVIALHFLEAFNEQLIASGIPRSVMMGALSLTLTTFIPGITGVTVTIGHEAVTAVVPAGTYEGAGASILFADGVMRRPDFAHFLLTQATLYFANAEGTLTATKRPVPYRYARSARFLLGQLMEGPHAADSVQGLSPCLPAGLTDAAIIGVAQPDDAVVVNFASTALENARSLDAQAERMMIYGLVNTLTALPGIKRVALFIDGSQPESLAGGIYLPGEFLRNPEIIAE